MVNTLRERLQVVGQLQHRLLLPIDVADDLHLGEHREALVEPEVLPSLVRDQVPAPRVRDLVGDYMHLGAVLGQQRGGDEGQARVLHASIGEAGRQNEKIVDAPPVGPAQRLASSDELLGVGKLPCALLDHLLLAPDATPRAHAAAREPTADDGHQVRRDRQRLVEAVRRPCLAAALRRLPLGLRARVGAGRLHGGHQRRELRGAPHHGLVARLALTRILARHHGPRVDRLALREHVREALARGLRWRQPLQRRAPALAALAGRGRLVADPHHDLTARRPRWQLNSQGEAQGGVPPAFVPPPARPVQRGAVHLHIRDLEVRRSVEHELPSLALGRRGVVAEAAQVDVAQEALADEVHEEVQVEVLHPGSART
mmetsp:Transcript_116423/g.336303  ORF Transcript_116423/g.336303 Transcript_116423/m.336303 type:complete len:372 (-) Transcript_116423:111-1226(-)